MIFATHPASSGESWSFADAMSMLSWEKLMLGVVTFGICLFVLSALRSAGGSDE